MPGPHTQILLFDGYDELDAVAPFEILVGAGLPVRLVTLSGDEPHVEGNHGLRTLIDGALDPAAGGLLVVPGGGWAGGRQGVRRAIESGDVPAAIGDAHAAGTLVASICTGGLLLGAAGLLQGRPAITHRAGIDGLAAFGADVREDARVVDDGDIVTSGGVTAGIDLSLHLVGRLVSPEAAEVQRVRIEHEALRPALVTVS